MSDQKQELVGGKQPIPPRIARMRKNELRKFVESDGMYGATTKACLERTRYMTEYMKQHEDEPYVLRRAGAFAHYLANKTIFITDDECLVGHPGHDLWSLPINHDIVPWSRLAPGERGHGALHPQALTKDEWKELEELTTYWKGKTLEDNALAEIRAHLPKEVMRFVFPPEGWKMGINHFYEQAFGATSASFPMLFSGLNAIKKKIEARIAELNPVNVPIDQANKVAEFDEKRNHLKAMLIAADGVIHFVERYRDLALDKAAKEKDPARKAELEHMAEILNIAEPVKTFEQAVQMAWIEHFTSHVLESMGGSLSQRLDQEFYPYYKHDIESGILTREKAREILCELWLKYERSMGILLPMNMRSGSMGSFILFQNCSLGGLDANGKDATNELTYLILETSRDMQCGQPTLSIQYNPETPDELLVKSFEVIKTGLGMPAFFNQKHIVEHLLNRGLTLEDARNNAIAGCVAWTVARKNTMPYMPSVGAFNAAKILEAAINDGADIMDGEQIGVKTGDPRKFKTYEDVVEAFKKQFEYTLHSTWLAGQIIQRWTKDLLTRPFSSCLSEKSIEVGLDLNKSQDYSTALFGFGCGMVDAIDALAGIKKLVFEEKKVTWDQMLAALKANWVGHEDVRQLCLNVPKFGEDEPYVDSIARDLFAYCDGAAKKFKDQLNDWYEIQYHSVSGFIMGGMATAALPNGRLARSPLADGGVSPELGYGREPTKVLKSVSRVDATKNQRMLLNMRLNPSTTPRQFMDLIRSWGDLGISQVQFNVFKTETLKAAQKEPEKYPDLMVRVAGYSAVFIDLTPPTQNAIIARAEQSLTK